MPIISVIIPLYNKEKYILRAVLSVLAQTFQDFEIIIVDDGSTDKGAQKILDLDSTKLKIIHQDNAGAAAARNTGILHAQADIVAFLDADDEWLPNFLETIVALKLQYPDGGIYATAYSILEADNSLKDFTFHYLPDGDYAGPIDYFQLAMEGPSPIICSAFAVPKILLEKTGMFPVGVQFGEDADLWGRIALNNTIYYTTKRCVIYHYGVENRTCDDKSIKPVWPFLYDGFSLLSAPAIHLAHPFLYEYLVLKRLYVSEMLALEFNDHKQAKKLLQGTFATKMYKKLWLRTWLSIYIPRNGILFLRFCWRKLKPLRNYPPDSLQ